MIIINNKGLVSFALMRELSENKKGVFDVLREFIIYCEKDKSDFTAENVVEDLNKYFNFEIPFSVIFKCLESFPSEKILKKGSKGKKYFSLKDVESSLEFKEIEILSQKNDGVIKDLNIFLREEVKDKTLTIESTYEDYYYYTIDKHEKLTLPKIQAISKFILSKKEEKNYIEILDKIQEGCLIYTGLINCNDYINIGKWKQNITLFLDTEILLNAYGFNGDELQNRFNDFYRLIEEININKKETIKLKYFQENRDEIDSIFLAVEKNFESASFFTGKTGFFKIKMEAEKKENVILIKHKFLKFLGDKDIKIYEKEINFTEPQNHKFNLIDQDSLENYAKDNLLEVKRIEETLTFFTKINILRAGYEAASLENAKYLFITLNSKTYNMAIQEKEKRKKKVAEATNLYVFTVYMWFKLNKGFADGEGLTSFKSINKASLIINGLIGNTFSQKLNEVKKIEDKTCLEMALAELVSQHYKFETSDNIDETEFLEELNSLNVNEIIKTNEKRKKELLFALKRIEELEKEKLEKEKLEEEKLKKEKLEKEKLEEEKLEREKQEKLEKEKKKKRIIIFIFIFIISIGITAFGIKMYRENKLFPMIAKGITGLGVAGSIVSIFPAIKWIYKRFKK